MSCTADFANRLQLRYSTADAEFGGNISRYIFLFYAGFRQLSLSAGYMNLEMSV